MEHAITQCSVKRPLSDFLKYSKWLNGEIFLNCSSQFKGLGRALKPCLKPHKVEGAGQASQVIGDCDDSN